MNCENCNCEHDGKYGSGRFCSQKCARGFSTKNNRKETNKKVSEKLKGRKTGKNNLTKVAIENSILSVTKNKIESDFDKVGLRWKKKKIFNEQCGKCNCCKLDLWMGEKIKLQLHHKDGNDKNNKRENLELLCPNCHSFTDNFGFNGRHHKKDSKEKIKNYMISKL